MSKARLGQAQERLRKQAEIDAAWRQHTQTLGELRRDWLDSHLASQRNLCAYCNAALKNAVDAGENRATIDHVIPLSRGGPDTFENTVAACSACNTLKGSMDAKAYRAHPVCGARRHTANIPPKILSSDPRSPHYEEALIQRGVGIRFNGSERNDVLEYSTIEGWIRVTAGKSFDRYGYPMTIKLNGKVEPYFKDL